MISVVAVLLEGTMRNAAGCVRLTVANVTYVNPAKLDISELLVDRNVVVIVYECQVNKHVIKIVDIAYLDV